MRAGRGEKSCKGRFVNTVVQPDEATAALAAGEPIGEVIAIDGSQARLRLRNRAEVGERISVGRYLAVDTGDTLAIGLVTRMATEGSDARGGVATHLDLIGEIKRDERGDLVFRRGVTEYPMIGDEVGIVSRAAMHVIFDPTGPHAISIGHLQHDSSIVASVNVQEMLSKHFAILGTTGVGKSSGVALILRETLENSPGLKIFLLDPHNEYGRCFGERAQVLNPHNLRLPFWLFSFEEIVDVFFRGRPGIDEETQLLQELIPLARARYAGTEVDRSPLRRGPRAGGFTVDTPVPYRLSDLVSLIDERVGKLENKSLAAVYARLITRVERLRGDPRYGFMFESANVGGDTMIDVVSELFRLHTPGSAMNVLQLAGFPAEVVDSVVSVLARMAFEFGLWSDGAVPLLFMCEESHRYAPADRTLGFGPTRKAISRIAKEGRKYGVFLGLVTQRPSELDPTIVSQCSTVFCMRMANEKDQGIVRSAVSDAGASFLAFVPSLGTREVFAFGEGVAVPTRMRFKHLADHLLPRSESLGHLKLDPTRGVDRAFVSAVVERWRAASMSGRVRREEDEPDFDMMTGGIEPSSAIRRQPGVVEQPVPEPAFRRGPYQSAPAAQGVARPAKWERK